MGKKQKNKPKQNVSPTSPVEEPKQIEEMKTPAAIGNAKLQRQMERDAREDERLKASEAAAERKRLEKNDKKKGNKKTPQRASNFTATASESNKYVPEKMSIGAQSIPESAYHKTGSVGTDSAPKQPIKLNRNFDYDTSISDTDQAKESWDESNPQNSDPDPCDNSWDGTATQNIKNENWGDTYNSERRGKNSGDYSYPKPDPDSWRNSCDSTSTSTGKNSGDYSYPKQPNYKGQNNKYSNFGSGSSYKKSFEYSKFDDGKNDKEFQGFWDLTKKRPGIDHGKVEEIKGDLFTAPAEFSLAHCVAEDMAMGAGIAKTFRSKFGRVGFLLNQYQRKGGLAVIEERTRFIYYLVTKEQSRGKPTYYTLWQSMKKLKDHMLQNNVTKLALPQIGCGLDRLEWNNVSQMIEHIFRDVEVEIVVYIWDESLEDTTAPKKLLRKCAVVHKPMDLLDIVAGTGLLYFGTADGSETEEFNHLASKFNFISAPYRQRKVVTDVLRTEAGTAYYIYGLIIRETLNTKLDYEVIEKAIKNLKKILVKDKTDYVGFQAFFDKDDKYLVDKIIALMQYIFIDVEIWVCWPDNLKDNCPQQTKSYY